MAEAVQLGDWDKPDWANVPVISKGDFCHKYSPALVLMGSAQHPVYAHPKMLGRCYDNVYHQGRLIRDLPAQGKNPKKVFDQEYEELIAENSLDLSLEGTAYPMVLTSLLNLEIVLPPKTFRELRGLLEVPPGCMPKPQEYVFDGAHGLVDLSWEQRVPLSNRMTSIKTRFTISIHTRRQMIMMMRRRRWK